MGQYRPLDSFLHRLDARSKIMPVMIVLVLSLLTGSSLFYISVLAVLVAGLLTSGVAPSLLWSNFKPILFLVAITAIYHLLFTGRDTDVLLTVFGFSITSGAVHAAFFYSLRLFLFVAIAFLVTLTSSPSELADAFTRILSPLQKIRVPVSDVGLILFMAIRFIPVLYDEFETIKHAQIVRGVRFSGSLWHRLKKTVYIIIPVFIASLHRADELALAIQARGYGKSPRRTYYTLSRFGGKDWLFVGLSTVVLIGIFWLTK